MQSVEPQHLEVRLDRHVLTFSQVEQARVLIISTALVPDRLVSTFAAFVAALLSGNFDIRVALAGDDHEDVLEVLGENRLVLGALEESVKVAHLVLLLNRELGAEELHLVHDVSHEAKLKGMFSGVNLLVEVTAPVAHLLVLEVHENTAELLLEALDAVLFGLLVLVLRVGHLVHVHVLHVGGLLKLNLPSLVEVVQTVDVFATKFGRVMQASGRPGKIRNLLGLSGGLIPQLLFTLGVQPLMDGHMLAFGHGLDNLLRKAVDLRLGLHLQQFLVDGLLLGLELFHRLVLEEALLIAQEVVQIASLATLTIQHGFAALASVRLEGAAFNLLLCLLATKVLEVLLADGSRDVFTHKMLTVRVLVVLGEERIFVLGDLVPLASLGLPAGKAEGLGLEAHLVGGRKTVPGGLGLVSDGRALVVETAGFLRCGVHSSLFVII